MNRRHVVLMPGSLAVGYGRSIGAQEPKMLPRLGILSARSPGPLEIFDAFRQGLRDHGYTEGKNIIVEYRFAKEQYNRLPSLMAEFINFKPDVSFTHTTPGVLAAIERPMRAAFAINLKTGNVIGIEIPPEVLQRADPYIQDALKDRLESVGYLGDRILPDVFLLYEPEGYYAVNPAVTYVPPWIERIRVTLTAVIYGGRTKFKSMRFCAEKDSVFLRLR